MLAIVGAGAIFTGTNPAYTKSELEHHIRASDSRFFISEPEIVSPLLSATKAVGIPDSHVRIFNVLGQDVPTGMQSWKTLLEEGEADWLRFDDLKSSQETTAARLFSSGTTGLPKAVTITHHNMAAQQYLVFESKKRPFRVSFLLLPTSIRVDSAD